jgi:Arc/MetJ-type ribon-helix-helix transcriptional regulator
MAEYPYDPPRPTGGPLTPTPAPTPAGGRAGDTIEEVTTTIRDFVNKVPETINKAIERALNVRDTTVLVRLSEATSDGLDTLVSAGIFKTRSEAAAFLVDEGIKTQGALFQRIRDKLTEIERLRAELRHSVSPELHRP